MHHVLPSCIIVQYFLTVLAASAACKDGLYRNDILFRYYGSAWRLPWWSHSQHRHYSSHGPLFHDRRVGDRQMSTSQPLTPLIRIYFVQTECSGSTSDIDPIAYRKAWCCKHDHGIALVTDHWANINPSQHKFLSCNPWLCAPIFLIIDVHLTDLA